ncbi:hypothetical protein [Vreelandella olivaria]|uniref:hypothetical protein n=1 Tax=Vreelandella olivaria TaxID=390919 RepID=UPI00201EF00C|nr:hypothetical protein [Halomonas olivaria]
MKTTKWTWAAYIKRQAGFFSWCIGASILLWNSVALGEWAYGLFSAELVGYGPGQQRWHRIWAIGFVLVFLFGWSIDTFNTCYYRKNPHEYNPAKKGKE